MSDSTMSDSLPRVLGVVLAGGKSTRMGRCKSELLHPGGGTYLERAVERMKSVCDEVAVSLAEESDHPPDASRPGDLPAEVHRVFDSQTDCGPAEGVARSLDLAMTLRCSAVLFTPVDVPRLQAAHLNMLISQFAAQPEKIICAISDDLSATKPLQPLIAVYPVQTFPEIVRLAQSERRGLYRFIQNSEHGTVALPADALHNVNSPHDLPS
ncbi:molybdenum cofactor guanylyltransferase [Rhodopirellula sallentina]|uniref:Molybdopterin-guanine dinucleotide biosynthesis protein A n=1 Tax=Rhodopirellula sallentina SM41 TaxID=1263870 RepID=M5TZK2_9BACT|nr:molybdenum cofactor guanylyltransferase [Rhodopirellula sallentina]EMI54637.1 molybdopterin-guanine dinucleotide biosynthesis protein A [Rhodopirellula sallentina SM41]